MEKNGRMMMADSKMRLGLDFVQYLCHSIWQHHSVAGPYPGHSKVIVIIIFRLFYG
ncbi:hypothetical protein ACFL7M_19030 [Thermodesulfobacteriota bacterium]